MGLQNAVIKFLKLDRFEPNRIVTSNVVGPKVLCFIRAIELLYVSIALVIVWCNSKSFTSYAKYFTNLTYFGIFSYLLVSPFLLFTSWYSTGLFYFVGLHSSPPFLSSHFLCEWSSERKKRTNKQSIKAKHPLVLLIPLPSFLQCHFSSILPRAQSHSSQMFILCDSQPVRK